MEEIVVVFDFDKTIIDVDSDNWVLDELGFTEPFEHLLLTIPWNTTMDMMMKEVHDKGVSIPQIVAALQTTPIHPRIVPTIKCLHSSGCRLRIVSDANLFFIETILEHHGVRACFASIEANPGHADPQGRVRIQPHHPHFPTSPHGCPNPNCAPNMCKGGVVENLVQGQSDSVFVYLGDGKGDYCPSLKLRERDIVMPRTGFPLCGLLSQTPELVRSRVVHWDDGAHLEVVLLDLVRALSEPTARLYSPGLDRKLNKVPVADFEAMSKPIRVPS